MHHLWKAISVTSCSSAPSSPLSRWTVAAGATMLFAAALVPYAAGEVISRRGYPGLEGLVLACGTMSLALALAAVLALRRAPSRNA